MAGTSLSEEDIAVTVAAIQKHRQPDGNVNQSAVARELGIARSTVRNRIDQIDRGVYTVNDVETPAFPDFPEEDVAIEDIIDLQCRRFEKRMASHEAHTWFPIKLKDTTPIGILRFGDPHMDDNGANWPALKRDVELCKTTPGLFGANIGDSTNNWSGRLVRLYANQDTSVKTARRMAEWFMLDSGVKWLIWLIGNHDAWGDGSEILAQMARRHGTHKLVCHDWEARFTLTFPNGWEPRVYASHDFKGHSMWNPLHGPMKEGQMGDDADLYVCGHKHNAAAYEFENTSRGHLQNFVRVRGYKFMDEYARRGGFKEQRGGCGAVTIFDPATKRVTVYLDTEEGADVLKAKRS